VACAAIVKVTVLGQLTYSRLVTLPCFIVLIPLYVLIWALEAFIDVLDVLFSAWRDSIPTFQKKFQRLPAVARIPCSFISKCNSDIQIMSEILILNTFQCVLRILIEVAGISINSEEEVKSNQKGTGADAPASKKKTDLASLDPPRVKLPVELTVAKKYPRKENELPTEPSTIETLKMPTKTSNAIEPNAPKGYRLLYNEILDVPLERIENNFILNAKFHDEVLSSLNSEVLESPEWIKNGPIMERDGVKFSRGLPFGADGLRAQMRITYDSRTTTQRIESKTNVATSVEIREFRPLGANSVQILIYGKVKMFFVFRPLQWYADQEQKDGTTKYFELVKEQILSATR